MRSRANSPQFRVEEPQARSHERTRTARLGEQRARKPDQAFEKDEEQHVREPGEKKGNKRAEDWRRGEGRTTAGECRVGEDGGGDGVRSPAAAGPPTGAVAGRGLGGGARVRGFLSFCIVAEGWDGREEGGSAT